MQEEQEGCEDHWKRIVLYENMVRRGWYISWGGGREDVKTGDTVFKYSKYSVYVSLVHSELFDYICFFFQI